MPDTPPGAKERPIVTSSKKASASNSKATSTSANNTSHKKKGRNQYTKDRDNESPAPARSTSRDIHGADNDLRFNPHNTRSGNAADSAPAQPPTASGGGGRTAGGNRPRSGRADKGHGDDNSSGQGHGHGHGKAGGIPARINIQDMKRRASAILEFIQRTQLELANEEPVPGIVSKLHARSTTTVARTLPGPNAGGSEEPISPVVAAPGMPQITVNGEANGATSASNGKADDNGAVDPPADTREFKELSCLEMMDAITRSLVKWQNRFESL